MSWKWLWGVFVLFTGGDASRPRCGGTFTDVRGALSTPNFPGEFPTPIRCEWVIEAQEATNVSIIVYLTQLFVFEGLVFTEYAEYDKRYPILPGKEIHRVTESNIFTYRWIQSYQNYLVVTLELDDVGSTHLRVLDHFLDVYGFNITYEITSSAPRDDACTMMDCGFTGNCYDHLTRFSCDCFAGYSGPNCSGGPKSPCAATDRDDCKNGATCINAGSDAFLCLCPEGFEGKTCEIAKESPANKACANCLTICPFNGEPENVCNCTTDKSNTPEKDRIAFSGTMHLSNLPRLSGASLATFIEKQVQQTMKLNYTRAENVNLHTIERTTSGAEVTLHYYGPKKDEKKVRSILRRWAARGYIGNLTVVERDVDFGSVLLQNVSISTNELIREGEEFVLSCVARGPRNMSFSWFKDGLFVNANLTKSNHKWSDLVQDTNDQYIDILAIDKATPLDEGIFKCQVQDRGIQQCRSIKVEIRKKPVVSIQPMSLTIQKDENFTIKCNSMEASGQDKYTYFWMKDGNLLPVRTKVEKSEILYPSGTILLVSKADKSVNYTCLVQDRDLSSAASVRVNVIDRSSVQPCASERHLKVAWPDTAPDTESVQECPRGYTGITRRLCRLQAIGKSAWTTPDFSGCTNNKLKETVNKFQKLVMAYQQTDGSRTLASYLDHLNGGAALLPGEGGWMLERVLDVIEFINDLKDTDETDNPAEVIFSIIDRVAAQKDAVVNEMQVVLLQRALKETARLVSRRFVKLQSVLHQPFTTIDVSMAPLDKSAASIHVPLVDNSYPDWYNYKLHVSLAESDNPRQANWSALLISLVYKNLTAFLPARSSIRLKDGTSIEYEVLSEIAAVWLFVGGADHRGPVSMSMEFSHPAKNIRNVTSESWDVICGTAEFASYGYSWDPHICQTESLNATTTRCVCRASGTFAVLQTTKLSPIKEKQESHEVILLVGCVICLLLSIISASILLMYWTIRRSCLAFLKLQCSLSIVGAMIVFIIAFSRDASSISNMYIMTFLEGFLLIGMSSQLSKLLIVYTEIVQLPRPASMKQTVIGIITGVPVITVFGTHLAHRTMNIKLNSWWLRVGTLSFNIFVTCSTVIFILFVFLYFIVTKKLKKFIAAHIKCSKMLKKRADVLWRSAGVFFCIVMVTASSIVYVNVPKTLFWHYEFSVAATLLGLCLILSYILNSEASMRQHFLRRLKLNKDDVFFSSDSMNSPLKFFTKQEPEVESEAVPHRKHQSVGSSGKPEHHLLTEPYQSPPLDVYHLETTSFTDKPATMQHNGKDLEDYSSSPKSFRRTHPDILSTKVCVELDLVASSMKAAQDYTTFSYAPPRITITPDEAIARILEDPSTKSERQQPEGRERIATKEVLIENLEAKPNVINDKLDGMLDSISHDLDYLLNRTTDTDVELENRVPVPSTSFRKISKPPAPSVIEEIQEEAEEETKVPESVTEIFRTEC